jgi:hypothetical protein
MQENDLTTINNTNLSTMTIIAGSNLKVDIEKFYKYLPIHYYNVVPKRRGRKSKNVDYEALLNNIPKGHFISIKVDNNRYRGVILKKVKNSGKFFKNSYSIICVIDNNKHINLKLNATGLIQITGCQNKEQYIEVSRYLLQTLYEIQDYTGEKIFEISKLFGHSNIEITYNIVMNNYKTNIGFPIDREKFNQFINDCKEIDFKAVYNEITSTGVICKKPNINRFDEYLDQYIFKPDKTDEVKKVNKNEYLKFLDEKQMKKIEKNKKFHTFLVFATSAIIFSSSGKDMYKIYNDFINCIKENRKYFEEKCSESQFTNEKEQIFLPEFIDDDDF